MKSIADSITCRGEYIIEIAEEKTGKVLKTIHVKNQLTEISQTVRSQMLMGTFTGDKKALAIRYVAVGSGTATAAATDTKLGNETFRKQITQISQPSTGIVRTVISIGAAEANGTIKEIGIFCGPTATSDADSGVLLSRTNVDITKNSNMVLNIIRTDTCSI